VQARKQAGANRSGVEGVGAVLKETWGKEAGCCRRLPERAEQGTRLVVGSRDTAGDVEVAAAGGEQASDVSASALRCLV
jgi:hypothetical protein